MKVNNIILKSRDIRGVYPEELNNDSAFAIGQAFVNYTKAHNVAVGRDMRISSPALFENLTKGIISQGANVYSIGQSATEYLYFAIINLSLDAGIMITASHNPKEYNGFKMFKRIDNGLEFVRGKDLTDWIKDYPNAEGMGEIKEADVWEEYINHIFSFINAEKINPFKIVIDAGNGMAGKVIPKISSKLPVEIISLNFELDGNFPVHPSNPLLEGVPEQVSKKVIEEKADMGFIFDGDADRVYLIDELGNFIKGDVTLLFLARYLLSKHSNSGIAYNLICSKAIPYFIEKWGGNPIRTAVGVVEVKEGMFKNNGILGGEVSGHYIFRDNFYMDSGFIAFLVLLQVISESGRKLSELHKELAIYAKADEISFEVEDKEKIIKKAKEKYSDGKQDFLDGITVEYKDYWFNIRPSRTEPLLRLTIEADSEKVLEKKKKELTSFIKKSA